MVTVDIVSNFRGSVTIGDKIVVVVIQIVVVVVVVVVVGFTLGIGRCCHSITREGRDGGLIGDYWFT